MDLTTFTPEDLDALRIAVLTEQERRANLAAIPAQVAQLSAQFISAGGDQAALDAAISPTETNPEDRITT